MARGKSRGLGGFAALVVVALAAAAIIAFGPRLLDRYGDEYLSTASCTATVDGGSHTLTAEQADNAALIAAVAVRAELPDHAVVVGLATAIQESGLRNVDYGDRDSLGLFQQRPSQGWGTEEQVTNRRYATRAFYDALVKVSGWEDMAVTDAAQAVQRSGFPDAYADHEPEARIWARR